MDYLTCEKCDYNKVSGQIEDHDGKIWNICVDCAWIMFDEVDGDVEIVDKL